MLDELLQGQVVANIRKEGKFIYFYVLSLVCNRMLR